METSRIPEAAQRLRGVISRTPMHLHERLSEKYSARVYLKREDQQVIRSYKIRGAYNKISSLNKDCTAQGIVCASAGNHAQGVAYSCALLKIKGVIFMPSNTPQQKISSVRKWGKEWIEIFLEGDNYDECFAKADAQAKETGRPFIHPFDDNKVIDGQGTVAMEICEDLEYCDYVFIPVGGGGLAAGVCRWFKEYNLNTSLIGVEPEGAASMSLAFETGKPIALKKIDPFVDGAAVKKVGDLNYLICKDSLHGLHKVTEGKACATLLELYNEDAIVVEPAGALAIAALDDFKAEIKNKTVVCIVSGGNNDIMRIEEIRKLADASLGLHHHLIIRFRHNPDDLARLFSILGSSNYVTGIEYSRREHGRSTYGLVGIKSSSKNEYEKLLLLLNEKEIEFNEVYKGDFLFKYLI